MGGGDVQGEGMVFSSGKTMRYMSSHLSSSGVFARARTRRSSSCSSVMTSARALSVSRHGVCARWWSLSPLGSSKDSKQRLHAFLIEWLR